MRVRILDLDGGIVAQRGSWRLDDPRVVSLRDWGPRIRIACSFAAFDRFERASDELLDDGPNDPWLTLYGSGDFHHVTLALLRRLKEPFHLLILDKHPDWMRGVPIMHCGTWLRHALRLPNLRQVFHLGGDLDFDNWFRWLAPWSELRKGKITVLPALRWYDRGKWRSVSVEPLREQPAQRVDQQRVEAIFAAFDADLARYPLYVSLDKDVMRAEDAVVNWDSGYLELSEVQTILAWFIEACGGRVAGMDILGDWSPVRVTGPVRRLLHWTEHPTLAVDPAEATRRNAEVNCSLVETVQSLLGRFSNHPISARAV